MKATGIIRRIDDLGRIVISREIRRTLHIREGDPLEIYVNDDSVIFKKYEFNCAHNLYNAFDDLIEYYKENEIGDKEMLSKIGSLKEKTKAVLNGNDGDI